MPYMRGNIVPGTRLRRRRTQAAGNDSPGVITRFSRESRTLQWQCGNCCKKDIPHARPFLNEPMIMAVLGELTPSGVVPGAAAGLVQSPNTDHRLDTLSGTPSERSFVMSQFGRSRRMPRYRSMFPRYV